MHAHINTHNTKEYPQFIRLRNNLSIFLNLPKRSGVNYHLNGKCHGKVSGSKRRDYRLTAWWSYWTGETKVKPEGKPQSEKMDSMPSQKSKRTVMGNKVSGEDEVRVRECWILDPKMASCGEEVQYSLEKSSMHLTRIGEDSIPNAGNLFRTYSLVPDMGKPPCVITCCSCDSVMDSMVPASSAEWRVQSRPSPCKFRLAAHLLKRSMPKLHRDQGQTPGLRPTGRMEFKAAKPSIWRWAEIRSEQKPAENS